MNDISVYLSAITKPKAAKTAPSEAVRVAIIKHLLLKDYAVCGALRAVPSAEEMAVMVEAIANGCKCQNRGLRWLFENARRWKIERKDPRPLTASDLIYVSSNYTNWGTWGIKPESIAAMLPAPEDAELLALPAVKKFVLYLNEKQKLLQKKD